jgi:flavin reductase (DIM6/NTAB) family NADH-FMN oxidoreductase RutF
MREVAYDVAIKRKYPEHIVLAVTWDAANKRPDIMVLGWAMPTSISPPMWAISVGHTRYTHKLLKETGEFVLAFPSTKMDEATQYCGTHSGRDIDKVKQIGLKTVPAKKIKPPILAGCPACFECKVKGAFETGDHTIFSGEVVASHVDEDESVIRIYNWAGQFGPAYRSGR